MVDGCLTSKVRKHFNFYSYLTWISTLGTGDLLTDPQVMTHPYISFVFCFNFVWMLIQVEIHLDTFPRTKISRPAYLVREMSMQHSILKHLPIVTISAIYIMIASASSWKSSRWIDMRFRFRVTGFMHGLKLVMDSD